VGAAQAAAIVAALAAALVAAPAPATAEPAAHADACTGVTRRGGRFATCFDPGNRLSVTAGTAGFGAGVALRHVIRFDDEPDLAWKMSHAILDVGHAGFEDRFTGVAYRGRFLRHARDGHLVLPFGIPRTLFLPFDIGAEVEVGRLAWRPGDPIATAGVVKTALLVDLARSASFRWRLAFGPVGRWDMAVAREPVAIAHHVVAPFSAGVADASFESRGGILLAALRVEAGTAWHSTTGWEPELTATATLERIVIAVNDRPVALVLGSGYATATGEVSVQVGARVVVLARRDPRVSLRALDAR
jgi:hypothetical protein